MLLEVWGSSWACLILGSDSEQNPCLDIKFGYVILFDQKASIIDIVYGKRILSMANTHSKNNNSFQNKSVQATNTVLELNPRVSIAQT